MRALLERVSRTYAQSDQDRYTLERSLMISSREMQALYAELERTAAVRLEKSLALANAVQEAVLDGILVTDERFAAMRFNARYVEMFGLTPTLGIPDPARLDLVSQQMLDSSAFLERVRSICADPSTPAFDELHLKDGRLIERYATPIRTSDGFIGRLWCFRDVTERRRLDADRMIVAERMASMGRLVASVAHEINNPLAFVCANLEHMAEVFSPSALPDFDELLSDTRTGVERILVIVRDLRSLSRAEEERRQPLQVERVIDSALQMAMNEVRHRACLVRAYETTPVVNANETRLAQVILNLIMNAAQALPDGRASQNTITIATGVDEKGFVRIDVVDTGSGIARENLERIFDPFFTTKPVGSGTGLGLAICRGIVEGYGGTVHVESEIGRGSHFIVRLPAAATTRSSMPASLASVAPGARVRVLVIDDEAAIRRAIVRALRGHDVVTSDSVRDAMKVIDAGDRFDAILCDMMMPDLTGMDFHAVLAAKAPEQLSRLAFISGGEFTPATLQFLAGVKNERLEKPFTNAALRAAVARIAGI